jgi:hypothetical protein
MQKPRPHPFRDSGQDISSTRRVPDTPQSVSASYRLAFADQVLFGRSIN